MKNKRFIAILLSSALALCGVAAAGQSALANGCITPAAGTSSDPFLIQNAFNLTCLKDNASYYWAHSPAYNFRLSTDLDMTGTTWSHGIGDASTAFNGVFDGNGHTISGLSITQSASGVAPISGLGFFGVTSVGSEIKNLKLSNIAINATHTGTSYINNTGVLVGNNASTVTNVSVDGTLSAVAADSVGGIGGLIGHSAIGIVSQVYANVTSHVTGFSPNRLGGLIGRLDASAISNCASLGGVTSTALSGTTTYFGGLVGDAQASSISDCFTMAALSTDHVGSASGSFIGNIEASSVLDSFWDNTMSPDFPFETGRVIATSIDHLNSKTTADLQAYATYISPTNVVTPWNIASEYESVPTHIWGLCFGVVSPFLMRLLSSDPCPPFPTVTAPSNAVVAGQSISVSGVNFTPNAGVRVELHSSPVILTTVTADGQGAFTVTLIIPEGTEAGSHTLKFFDLVGWTTSDFPITVTPALANTAAPQPHDIVLAIVTLLAGSTLLLYARRRLVN